MFIGFLVITTCSFRVSGTEGEFDRSFMSAPAHFRALRGIQVKFAVISTSSSLPSSRPRKYVAGVKNCYAELLTGAWGIGDGGIGDGGIGDGGIGSK